MRTDFETLEQALKQVKTVEDEDRVLREHGWTWSEYYHEAQRRDEESLKK